MTSVASKFEPMVKPGGLILINSSLVGQPSKREDVTVINVPVNDIAMELGNEKVANMVMLGALVRATDVVSESSIEKVMKKTLTGDKAELLGLNMKAFAYYK
jgi:2-oxoglutarate ferredoxin oxidoreductase subunit gamma